jgi:hypothetical protein
MRNVRYKQIIVTLWLISFIGQALASASLCCASLDAEQGAWSPLQFEQQTFDADGLSTTAIDHAQHQMPRSFLDSEPFLNSKPFSDTASTTAECNTECECAAGSCSPAVLSASQSAFNAHFVVLSNSYTNLPQDQLITSLFRPPISR